MPYWRDESCENMKTLPEFPGLIFLRLRAFDEIVEGCEDIDNLDCRQADHPWYHHAEMTAEVTQVI